MPLESEVREALREEVFDPELMVNIVDLGLVYAIRIDQAGGSVEVDMTLTSPGCPLLEELDSQVRSTIGSFPDVQFVDVHFVWSPPWDPSMMSEDARDELGIFEF